MLRGMQEMMIWNIGCDMGRNVNYANWMIFSYQVNKEQLNLGVIQIIQIWY